MGIANFNQVLPGVASGLRPDRDGLEWLHTHGYQAVLRVRSPLEDETAERDDVERRGLHFRSLMVSPSTLSRSVVQEFSRLVHDPRQQPLFVYDRDGSLAGGLWYLHFRLSEQRPEEEARLLAQRLGLKADVSGYQDLWLAIQRVLAEQP